MYDQTRCTKILRSLIVAEAIAFGFLLVMTLVGIALAEGEAEARGIPMTEPTSMETSAALLSCAMLLLYLPLIVISWYGMYYLLPWSRWLYLGTVAVMNALSMTVSLVDFSFVWGFPEAFASVVDMMTGAILVLAFASPAAQSFVMGSSTSTGEIQNNP